jgi:hypothetical protein
MPLRAGYRAQDKVLRKENARGAEQITSITLSAKLQ